MDEEVTTIEAREAYVRLEAPEDCTSISIRGMQFDVPASRVVEAPADVAKDLMSHGFVLAAPKPKGRVKVS